MTTHNYLSGKEIALRKSRDAWKAMAERLAESSRKLSNEALRFDRFQTLDFTGLCEALAAYSELLKGEPRE